MPNYAIYDATGVVLRTLQTTADRIDREVGEGELVLECDAGPYDTIDVEAKTVIRGAPPAEIRRYVIAKVASGEISRDLMGTAAQAAAAAVAGEVAIVHSFASGATHYVVDGAVVAYTTAQVAAKKLRPPYVAQWSNTTFSWQDRRTLQQHKDDKIEEMKRARDAASVDPGPLATPFGDVNGDAEALKKVQEVLAGWGSARALEQAGVGAAPVTIDWIMYDNVPVPITYEQLSMVAVLLLQRGQIAFAKYTILRDQINAIEDGPTAIDEVEAIQWSSI